MPGFFAFLLILVLVAAFLRVDFFFTIAYLLLAVYLLARLWTRRTLGHLRARRRFADRAFPGEQVTVEVAVQNAGWLPLPWLEVYESLPVDLMVAPFRPQVIALGPHGKHQLHYLLACRRRGYYLLGPLTMQTGDLLGMVERGRAEVAPEHIIVYPRLVPLQELGLPTHSPRVALPARSPLFEDPARVMGVRDYRRGDSPRRIHWPATARTGRLLVKQYQPSIARETLICLDLAREDYAPRHRYTATELAIVTAASVAAHVGVRERLPVGLATDAWDPLADEPVRFLLPPRSGRAYLMGLLEVLARVQPTSTGPFADLLRQGSVNLPWGATLMVVAGRQDEALLDALVHLRRAGFAVTLILVQPDRPSAEMERRADLLGVPVHQVWTDRDLETWR